MPSDETGEPCRTGERPLAIEAPGDPLEQDAPVAFAARSARAERVGTRFTKLTSGVLPAGAYHVSGAVRIKHPDGVSEDARITCALLRPNGKRIAASTATATFRKGDDAGEVTLPISATVDRLPAGRSSLACKEVALGRAARRGRSSQQRSAPGSPGVLSGNVVQVPVHVPVNVCGNSVDAVDLLNPEHGQHLRESLEADA